MRSTVFRSPGLRPLLLSLVVVTTFASKFLHLIQHIRSVPQLLFLLYLPTFFLIDLTVSVFSWYLLSLSSGVWSVAGLAIVAVLGYVLDHPNWSPSDIILWRLAI